MKLRNPAVLGNPSRSKEIEVGWNLPARLDVLTDSAVSHGNTDNLAFLILDAASALAFAKGEWYGQDDVTPILSEVEESLRIVSSRLFDNPNDSTGESIPNPERTLRATKCMKYILDKVGQLERSPYHVAA